MSDKGHVSFTADEMRRINRARNIVGSSYVEFIHAAVMFAVDEVEGTDREAALLGRVRDAETRSG